MCQKVSFPILSFSHLLHALLKEGVPPGLADDKIGPLDHHDAHEEGGVTGEFNDLPLLVCLESGNGHVLIHPRAGRSTGGRGRSCPCFSPTAVRNCPPGR